MPKKYDVVVGNKYTNAQGEEKTSWKNIGAVFEKDGKFSIKLESIPVGEWNGWASLFEPRPKDSQPQQSAPQQSAPSKAFDDDLPAF